MALEIERKFTVNKEILPELNNGILIKQCYLLNSPQKTIRIRIKGEKAYITLKTGGVGISRNEYEYEIPYQDAEIIMFDFEKTNIIEKTRYLHKQANHIWEIDIFHGNNEGLILAEIELNSETEVFDKPEWIEKEVSENANYFNSSLANNPFKNWEQK